MCGDTETVTAEGVNARPVTKTAMLRRLNHIEGSLRRLNMDRRSLRRLNVLELAPVVAIYAAPFRRRAFAASDPSIVRIALANSGSTKTE